MHTRLESASNFYSHSLSWWKIAMIRFLVDLSLRGKTNCSPINVINKNSSSHLNEYLSHICSSERGIHNPGCGLGSSHARISIWSHRNSKLMTRPSSAKFKSPQAKTTLGGPPWRVTSRCSMQSGKLSLRVWIPDADRLLFTIQRMLSLRCRSSVESLGFYLL